MVKNSGHDYNGRSAGVGALALWVRNYTPAPTLEKNFIPEGCSQSAGDVVTFGTGENFDGVYKFAYQNNVTIIGGSSPTVHPGGGWISGGGHSPLSPVYGLGVDNVQQLRVVLPNGTYLTANHCQNQDIFFALRGGGGGTFGVIMEMSTLARPQLTLQWASITFFGLDEESQRQVLTVLVKNANSWFQDGWGGYIIPGATFPVWLMNPVLNPAAANASLQPLLDLATQLGATVQVTTYQSFQELYEEQIKNSEVARAGVGFAEASRLIPSKQFEGEANQAALTKMLLDVISPTRPLTFRLMLLLTTPSRTTQDSDSAITPAWRSSTWHVIISTSWDSSKTSVDQVDAIFRNLTAAMDPLRHLTPGSGAYLNEADTFEPDHISAFWGKEHYGRLQSIKQQVDPHNLMQVHRGVNYNASNPLFSCYPTIPKHASQQEKAEELQHLLVQR